jgi:uncharacterized membrane protein YeiH
MTTEPPLLLVLNLAGTLRNVLIRQIPSGLRSGLYAIAALVGATITVSSGWAPTAVRAER